MTVDTCVPSDLYAYIFHFLATNGLKKSAKSFKKETGQDFITPAAPGLVEIFNDYLSRNKDIFKAEDNKTEDTVNTEKEKRKRKHVEEDTNTGDNKVAKKRKKKDKKINKENKDDEPLVEKPEEKDTSDKTEKKKKKKKNKQEVETETENPVVVVEDVIEVIDNPNIEIELNSSKISQGKNVPFRRVKEEEVFVPHGLRDNRFEAKIGSQGDWGERANRDLKYTQGKSFRHEKTKKKRGSYKGGIINTSVNSIKFDCSD